MEYKQLTTANTLIKHVGIFSAAGDCLCPCNKTGGLCQKGYYCPTGSHDPLPCPEGMYCNQTGLSLPTGDCDPGYYCSSAAIRADPQDISKGGLCPEGRYCGKYLTKKYN